MGKGNTRWTVVWRMQLVVGAIVTLLFASLLHSWYSGNAAARITQRAGGFMMFGGLVLAFSIFLLLCGLALLWGATSFVGVIIGVGVYFFVLPLLTVPLLTALNLIPPRDDA